MKNDEYTQPYYNLKTVLYHWIKTGFRRAYMSVVQLLIRAYTVLRISYKPMPYKRAYTCNLFGLILGRITIYIIRISSVYDQLDYARAYMPLRNTWVSDRSSTHILWPYGMCINHCMHS